MMANAALTAATDSFLTNNIEFSRFLIPHRIRISANPYAMMSVGCDILGQENHGSS
jgi:hypothetical protein